MSMLNLATGDQPLETFLFCFFAAATALSAVGVALARNVVRMAVLLLFALTGVAGLYVLLSAEFLAAVQLLVYVGGTLVLIVFGVMMTSRAQLARLQPRRGEVLVAGIIGSILLVLILVGIHVATTSGAISQTAAAAADPQQPYPVLALGQALLSDYLVPFEVASILLLVVMIGAAYLAKSRRKTQTGRPYWSGLSDTRRP